jgi:Tfp pilus assembly PilM family ATPase
MARKKESITGIEIASRAICCAQCYPADNLIASISIQPISAPGSDYWSAVSGAVKELVSNPEVKLSGENVVSALPGEHAVIRKVTIDSEEKNIEDAIEWEFSQHIIESRDEYVYDLQQLSNRGGSPEQRYLVVGYRQASVSRINRILSAHKLNPIIIDLDIFALINVFEMNNRERLQVPAFIIFSEEDRTKIILTQAGEFVDLEVIAHEHDSQEPEQYLHSLRSGIDTMLFSNPAIGKQSGYGIYLTGSTFSDDVFSRHILDTLEGSEILYPFRTITCSAGMKEDDLRHYSPQLAVAVGLALRESD